MHVPGRWLKVVVSAGAGALMLAYAGPAQGGPDAFPAAQRAASAARSQAARPQAAVPPACPSTGHSPLYRDTRYSFAVRAADLVSCMTLAEKVGQLRTDNAPAIPRLGVQQYTYWSEGLHGISKLRADGGTSQVVQATSFPVNFAATMTWDPQLVYQGDHGDLRRGARIARQVAVGYRPEQPGHIQERLQMLTYRFPSEHGSRPAMGPH